MLRSMTRLRCSPPQASSASMPGLTIGTALEGVKRRAALKPARAL